MDEKKLPHTGDVLAESIVSLVLCFLQLHSCTIGKTQGSRLDYFEKRKVPGGGLGRKRR